MRDLDAWLLLDGSQLVAVECKHRTAASIDARQQWTTLQADHIETGEWTDHNKVYLPLRPPPSLGTAAAALAMLRLQRVLAIWRPISCDGISFRSEAASTSISNDQLVPATAEVFSASLYLRSLRDRGETRTTGVARGSPSMSGLPAATLQAAIRTDDSLLCACDRV